MSAPASTSSPPRSALYLDSLEIEGYRLFRHLTLPRLGRVNLLTGRNNVGKTAVLEALRLHAHRGSPAVLFDILESRDEIPASRRTPGVGEEEPALAVLAVQNLFHGRPAPAEPRGPIRIGPSGRAAEQLRIEFRYLSVHPDETISILSPKAEEEEDAAPAGPADDADAAYSLHPLLKLQFGYESLVRLSGARLLLYAQRHLPYLDDPSSSPPCRYVPAGSLSSLAVAELWDAVALTEGEEQVVTALRLVSPDLERISVTAPAASFARPVVRARLGRDSAPVPLRSLGDGINRLLGIALALVTARGGLLLLDEVENGIHYSVQADLWRLVFATAARLDVQVFATTHSYDCIQGFQEAARETPEEGVLIRLEEKAGQFRVTTYDEERLAVVTREEIEVR